MLVNDVNDPQRRARVRRNAILLGLVALAFYIGFIWMSVSRATS